MGIIISFLKYKGVISVANIFDVANFFINKSNKDGIGLTHLKLQKLCYYAQVWSLVWNEKPLFKEDFEAWVHGPVCPELFQVYRDFGSGPINIETYFSEEIFDCGQLETLEQVWNDYGCYSGDVLRSMTHQEEPWIHARNGIDEWERCNTLITKKSITDYYSRFYNNEW